MSQYRILKRFQRICMSFGLFALQAPSASAFFVDGSGHYGVRGFTILDPAANPARGMPQAIEQTFRLEGEFRTGDSASFFAEFRLFKDARNAYLGDTAQSSTCQGDPDCNLRKKDPKSETQSVSDPGYQWLLPKVTELYLRYAFEYCILEAGRRPRDWGLGIFMDSGKRPFSISSTYFDGVSCDVNIQKFQDLGFTVGYDKLAESGSIIRAESGLNPTMGPDNRSDDVDQIFLSISYDDRKTRPNSSFNKNIGIYAANIKSGPVSGGGLNTDLSIADFYVGLYTPHLSFRNEFLFRIGSSADPNAYALGGATENSSGDVATNRLNSIGFAGSLEWLMAGPVGTLQPYQTLSGTRHYTFFEWAYAPGARQGYYNDSNSDSPISLTKRDTNAKAIAFNANYTPGLILFNGRSQIDDLKVDGVFDPKRVMNAQVYSLGYRLENKDYGTFEPKLITAMLNEGPSNDVKAYYAGQSKKKVGYYGRSLGYELDLKYSRMFSGGFELGAATGALLPGHAWQTSDEQKPLTSYIFQAWAVYKF